MVDQSQKKERIVNYESQVELRGPEKQRGGQSERLELRIA